MLDPEPVRPGRSLVRERRHAQDQLAGRLAANEAAHRFGLDRSEVAPEIVLSSASRVRLALGRHGDGMLYADKDRYRLDQPAVFTFVAGDRSQRVHDRAGLDHAMWQASQHAA